MAPQLTNMNKAAGQKSTPKFQPKKAISARAVALSAKARSAAAAAKVFHTVELLEAILSELPIRYLLLAQRVSRHWQQVIQDSIRIQQAPFFKPIPLEPLPIYSDFSRYSSRRKYKESESLQYVILKNPLLAKIFKEVGSLEVEGVIWFRDRIYKGYGRDGRRCRPLHRSWEGPTAS